ncbi:MFS transporter, putative metabolite:H+ symporter [Actinopolyspora mzabensis]|uniref:MFS transporter, putative metabolite:H+ symporter n=1 Tax=Actinopolyspora mzabensis TaxID=995066 RepID=A0A1G9FIW4_ACTMZ|nr:MFS transporter [Actinopolyspora mzabensis]SDK88324.1 MFS transporter, putative metabolite:H+ symporter [Actinopolyspora mzabensis]
MTASTRGPSGAELLARLDRLPQSKPHRRLMLQGGMGHLFEAYDGVLLAYAASAVVTIWAVDSTVAGWLLASVFIGYLIGSLLAGVLADWIGRRRVLMYALFVYVVFTLLAATATGPGELILWRVLSGIGIGAEATTIVPYISEFLPRRNRGRSIGRTMMFLGVGHALAGLTAVLVISPQPEPGWRIACLSGALPVLLLLWWRRTMVESPRFLIDKGRVDEAREIVERIERETAEAGNAVPAPPEKGTIGSEAGGGEDERSHHGSNPLRRMAALWGPGMARRSTVVCLLWFAFQAAQYGYGTWLPTLLVLKGFTISTSFAFAMAGAVAQIPGYYLAASISERLDRKWTIVLFLVGSVGCAAALGTAGNATSIFCFNIALSFCMNGVASPLYAYTTEIYPTGIRTSGMGMASAMARVGAILAPVVIGYVQADLGFGGVFAMLCGLLFFGSVILAVFGLRTAGRSLEGLEASGRTPAPTSSESESSPSCS